MLNYAVVMPWNNTAQELLLERDLFRTAPPLTECCCWGQGACYESWPTANGSVHVLDAAEAASCAKACVFSDAHRATPLNLTTDQRSSPCMPLLARAPTMYPAHDERE